MLLCFSVRNFVQSIKDLGLWWAKNGKGGNTIDALQHI